MWAWACWLSMRGGGGGPGAEHGRTMVEIAKLSILAAALGVPGTAFLTIFLVRRESTLRQEISWLLGIGALLPAWLIAFLGLMGDSTGAPPEKALKLLWMVSSATALLGVIVTDALLKRLRGSGREYGPLTCWLLGAVTLVPAWGIALIGLLVRTPGK